MAILSQLKITKSGTLGKRAMAQLAKAADSLEFRLDSHFLNQWQTLEPTGVRDPSHFFQSFSQGCTPAAWFGKDGELNVSDHGVRYTIRER
jgi:hypothetical protein